jgi:sugar phosphate isomerase/epimerase
MPSLSTDEKLQRICVSSWSFHHAFSADRSPWAPPVSARMDFLAFPEMVADRYHVHNLEIVSLHLPAVERSYLEDFKQRLERTRSQVINIAVDVKELWEKPALSGTEEERTKAIALYKPWIEIGRQLGAQSVRCDPGRINPDDIAPPVRSYRELVAEGESKGIRIVVENHGELASRHPEILVSILKASGAGALPDFGNFPDQATRERGLQLLFPLATTLCHAKLRQGGLDFASSMKTAQAAGFTGYYSIESSGPQEAHEAVQEVLEQLVEHL